MTNKEAIIMLEQLKETIKILEQLKDKLNYEVSDSQKKIDALNMAIKTLEQTQFADGDRVVSFNDRINDLISAIENDECQYWTKTKIISALKKLPSTSQLSNGDKMVSLNTVINALDTMTIGKEDNINTFYRKARQTISELPSVSQNSDCISRQKVIDMLNDIDAEVNDGCGYMYEHWMDYIKQLSSVTSQPKTGHWIDDDTLCHSWRCNQCYWLMRSNRTNFCPNCGADMRGDENG